MKIVKKIQLAWYRRGLAKEFGAASHNRSAADNGLYPAFCRKAADDADTFDSFRRHPIYTRILEHVPQSGGQSYLDYLEGVAPDLLDQYDRFRENDLIGQPALYHYERTGETSPTTLRYLKVAHDIRTLFGDRIDGQIAEIGGGYGGQLLIMDKLLRFQRYVIFDLPTVNRLIDRYINHFVLANSYLTRSINQAAANSEFDLVISNYAFSELPPPLQRIYCEKIIRHAKRGYLTMNSAREGTAFFEGRMTLAELEEFIPPYQIIECSGPDSGGFIIIWGHSTDYELQSIGMVA